MPSNKDSRTVCPSLVHKQAASEVLITVLDVDLDGWTAHARLEPRHRFYHDVTGRQSSYNDPLYALEAFRQGCIAAGHLIYRVPLGFHYLVRSYEFAVLDWGALETCREPADLEFRTHVRREFRPDPRAPVNGLEVTATASRNGVSAMSLSVSFGWVAESRWQPMRARSRWEAGIQPFTVDPVTVGRRLAENVVVGAPLQRRDDGSVCAPVVVDTRNPTFFDHPLDHLPGSLILEACRQLALAALGPRSSTVLGPSRLRCEFRSFAELQPSCVASLAPVPGALAFRGKVSQSGQDRALVELDFATVESPE